MTIVIGKREKECINNLEKKIPMKPTIGKDKKN
jgi:hypothetical protein